MSSTTPDTMNSSTSTTSTALVRFNTNLYQNRPLLPLPSGWTTASKSPTSFTKFQELPAELRLKIYGPELHQRRIITFRAIEDREAKEEFLRGILVDKWIVLSDTRNPRLLFVNKEIREEALKIYRILRFDTRNDRICEFFPKVFKIGCPIYFSVDHDTFAFGWKVLIARFAREKFAGIRSVAWLYSSYYYSLPTTPFYCVNNFFDFRANFSELLVIVPEATREEVLARGGSGWLKEFYKSDELPLLTVKFLKDY